MTRRQDVSERILQAVRIDENQCWVWQGYKNRGGYGRISVGGGRKKLVHRAAYELLVGTIPGGLQLDHLCRNHACCNPRHLEPVTHRENHRRGMRANQTHCKRGHEFAVHARVGVRKWKRAGGEVVQRTFRACRPCARIRYAIKGGTLSKCTRHPSPQNQRPQPRPQSGGAARR